jgi:hypothetical protein
MGMAKLLRKFATLWTLATVAIILACAVYHVYWVAPSVERGVANLLKVWNPVYVLLYLQGRFFAGDSSFFVTSLLWAAPVLVASLLALRLEKRT